MYASKTLRECLKRWDIDNDTIEDSMMIDSDIYIYVYMFQADHIKPPSQKHYINIETYLEYTQLNLVRTLGNCPFSTS